MEEERLVELMLKHLNVEVTHKYEDMFCGTVDLNIYSETTRDQYEVFIISHTDRIHVSDNVFYYEHGLVDDFVNEVRDGHQRIFVDPSIYEDCYFESHLADEFPDFVEEIVRDLKDDITEEELEFLKEEYGIEDEETT